MPLERDDDVGVKEREKERVKRKEWSLVVMVLFGGGEGRG